MIYYHYSGEVGAIPFPTFAEAVASAELELKEYRDVACDGWPEEAVAQISHCGPEKRGAFVLFKEDRRADNDRNRALEEAAIYVETHKPCGNQSSQAIRRMASGELQSIAQIEYARAIRGLKT